ncbi:MAG: sugar transferase [Opitutales bacterium]|nr:sugar transferase [Opitutales bacterium]MCH8541544.1 sugar transferase [Opitutales bacterium]
MYKRFGKRCFDLLITLLMAPLVILLLLILYPLVRYRLGAPVFFFQKRPGRHGKPFYIVKLRSMSNARDAHGELLPDEDRLTPFGDFLRKTSLDELPEFWNIGKGEMSLVGPRPLRMDYLPLYSAHQNRRHEIRPGLTGWAQVHGRNITTWPERLNRDVWYVDNMSIVLDLKILCRTLLQVFRKQGISAPNHSTMPPFRGER